VAEKHERSLKLFVRIVVYAAAASIRSRDDVMDYANKQEAGGKLPAINTKRRAFIYR
jgi:hypothetical protein